jgi:hypothetical protein
VEVPYRLTEFDDLSRRYYGLLPDVVDSYKEQALARAFDSVVLEHDDEPELSHGTGISHDDIMDVAEKIVLNKFEKVAKRRIYQNPRTKAFKRRGSVDTDEIEKLADEKLITPAMPRKRKVISDMEATESTPTKRTHRLKRQRIGSDKENEDVPENPLSLVTGPLAASLPTKKVSPEVSSRGIRRVRLSVDIGATMPTQLSKAPPKRALRELSPQTSNRRPKLSLSAGPDDDHNSFSDASSLFEEELAKQSTPTKNAHNEATTKQDLLGSVGAHLPSPPETLASPKETVSERESVRTAPTSSVIAFRAMLKPFVREPPMPLKSRNPALAFIQPEGRVTTCFRIAEALRLRAKELHAPIPITEVGNRASITVELYARLQQTYRHGVAQLFVFEDIFFPGRPPFLRGKHASWQECQQQLGRMRQVKDKGEGIGGELCRALIVFNIDRSGKPDVSQPVEGTVLNVRQADWGEIRRVRGIVEPKWQEVNDEGSETVSSGQGAATPSSMRTKASLDQDGNLEILG